MKNQPPKKAIRFLRWLCREDYLEEIEGDLVEIYELNLSHSPKRARMKFILSVLRYFRPIFIKSVQIPVLVNPMTMFRHNLLLTIRNVIRYKGSFFINLVGLSTGLACAMLIGLWVKDEVQTDKFHANDTRLYQAMLHHEESDAVSTIEHTQGLLANALEEEVPEVEEAVASTNPVWFGDFVLSDGKNKYKAGGMFADSGFFSIFSYPLLAGNELEVLSPRNSIVLSESLAKRIFNSAEGVVGKTLRWEILQFSEDVIVTGIFADLPKNSTEQFDFVLSFEAYRTLQGDRIHWGNYNAVTYVLLKENADVEALNAKLEPFITDKFEWSNVRLFLKPYSSKYLHGKYVNGVQSGGRIEYVKLFSIIALFILLIACINFMNLSTAKASRRVKEVGIKKAIGVNRNLLIGQYLTESLLITSVSVLVAVFLVELLLPAFNLITQKQLDLSYNLEMLGMLLGITLITGILAGSYPALYLSRFKPVEVLKGKLSTSFGALWTRKGLVIFQFTLSIILIISVAVVYKQLEFVQTMNLGYDRENIVVFSIEGKSAENLDLFQGELKKVPGVNQVSATSHPLVKGGSYTTGVEWEGKNPDAIVKFENVTVGFDFVETIGAKIKHGRTFSREYGDEGDKMIFNEAAIKLMNLEDPIGAKVKLWGEDMQIIGVVEDFHFQTLHEEVQPMFLRFDPDDVMEMLVKVVPGQEKETIEAMSQFYKEINPGYSFDYRFLDEDYNRQYSSERRVSVLSQVFAGIAVLISCLGLFGLAAFTAERKLKEIGIRRILGASEFKIVQLLSGEFAALVLISVVIALPLSYFLASSWLQGFAYHIDLSWWYFVGGGTVAFSIALITVAVHTIKAARVNPADCLKTE